MATIGNKDWDKYTLTGRRNAALLQDWWAELVVHGVSSPRLKDIRPWPEKGEVCCSIDGPGIDCAVFGDLSLILQPTAPGAITFASDCDCWSEVADDGSRYATSPVTEYEGPLSPRDLVEESYSGYYRTELWVEASRAKVVGLGVIPGRTPEWLLEKAKSMYPGLPVVDTSTWEVIEGDVELEDLYWQE